MHDWVCGIMGVPIIIGAVCVCVIAGEDVTLVPPLPFSIGRRFHAVYTFESLLYRVRE